VKTSIHTERRSLKDKRIFITGGTTGIGRAIANLLGAEGAKLFICGRHEPEMRDALKDIQSTGATVSGGLCDLARQDEITRIFGQAVSTLGGLDILINNAGLAGGGIEEDEDWRYIVETNLMSYIGLTKEAVPLMKRQGGGHIVLIGSISADSRKAGSSIYVATKSGIQGFAAALRKEVNKMNINVSLVEPGSTGSDMQDESPQEQAEMIRKLEMLRAEDIAVAVQYILTQPPRCDVTELEIRPLYQLL